MIHYNPFLLPCIWNLPINSMAPPFFVLVCLLPFSQSRTWRTTFPPMWRPSRITGRPPRWDCWPYTLSSSSSGHPCGCCPTSSQRKASTRPLLCSCSKSDELCCGRSSPLCLLCTLVPTWYIYVYYSVSFERHFFSLWKTPLTHLTTTTIKTCQLGSLLFQELCNGCTGRSRICKVLRPYVGCGIQLLFRVRNLHHVRQN